MRRWLLVMAALLMGGSTAEAAPWTFPKGGVYAGASLLGTRSRSLFNDLADRVRFLNNGLSRVAGVSLDGAYGVTNALTVSAIVPVLFYQLRDDFVLEEGISLGDVRASVRYRLLNRTLASSVEAALKFPTATGADPARIQVGEGQYDVDLIWSLGGGWGRLPGYASLDLGYRVRRRNGGTGFKPGDEVIFRAGTGYRLSDRLSAGLSLDGFWGRTGNTKAFNLNLPTSRSARRLVVLAPAATYRLTDRIGLDLRVSLPAAGRNYYAGNLFTVALSFSSSEVVTSAGGTWVPTPRGGSCCRIQ